MKEKGKYQTCLKNEHYKTQCKMNKGKICVPFSAIFAKNNVRRKDQNKLSLSSFN